MAVPLWIDRMRTMTDAQRCAVAQRCATTVASSGDTVLFRSTQRGGSASAFNALAEGLAALAFSPGGVRFAGLHFEV